MSTESIQASTSLPAGNEAANAVTPVVGSADLLGLGASMFVVVAIIVLLGWLYSRSRFVSGGAGHLINVVASRALGPKERLMIIEVEDQQLLIGMTASAVQTLHVFEKPVRDADPDPQVTGFGARLRAAFREMRA